jgi:hypothetical protein
MTEQEWIDLGHRAVACRAWRWLPGMLAMNGVRANGEQYGGSVWVDHCGGSYEPVNRWVPDLRDPATVGCLLALVREAYPNNDLYVDFLHTYRTASGQQEFAVYEVHDQRYIPKLSRTNGGHPTEAEALVAALEDAR